MVHVVTLRGVSCPLAIRLRGLSVCSNGDKLQMTAGTPCVKFAGLCGRRNRKVREMASRGPHKGPAEADNMAKFGTVPSWTTSG